VQGGGSASRGSFDSSNRNPHGFYIDGSSLTTLNGIYGPRSSEEVFDDWPGMGMRAGGDNREPEGMFVFEHDHGGWVLARVPSNQGEISDERGFEWVLVDTVDEERFVYEDGGTMRPKGGVDWRRVEGRGSRFVRKGRGEEDGAVDQDQSREAEDSTGEQDEETETKSDNNDEDDGRDEEKEGDEAELQWLIGAIPNAIYFEQYLSKQRKHDAALSTALQLRNTLPPGTTHETAPPKSCAQNPAPGRLPKHTSPPPADTAAHVISTPANASSPRLWPSSRATSPRGRSTRF